MSEIKISRRGFVVGAVGAAGAGALFTLGVAPARGARGEFQPNVWVRLEPDGTMHLTCNRSEMGQGVRSSIPALLAKEIGADLSKMVVVQAPGHPDYGVQNTDGSRSIRNQYEMLQRMGAVARTMLEQAGAAHLKVPVGEVTCEAHAVVHRKSGRKVAFGKLTSAAAKRRIPDPDAVKLRSHPAAGWDLPLVDAEDWVTGRAKFGADIVLEGMLTAVVVRPPVLGAEVAKVDDEKARAMPGVVDVVKMPTLQMPALFKPLGGVAVVAKDTWTAKKAAAALEIRWSASPNDGASWAKDLASMRAAVTRRGTPRRTAGDADKALAAASKTVEATYVVPHLAHAALEPPAALAHYTKGACEVWANTQTPQNARNLVAKQLGLPPDKVTVHVTFLGAAFGRKSKPDYVVEAAFLSKAVGKPVRVQWLREDAMRQGYFHACSVQALAGGFDDKGELVAWRQRIASPTISSTFDSRAHELSRGELGQGLSDLPLVTENLSIETHEVQERLRIGWMRSVYNINHAFAVQCFLDELAHARGVKLPDFVKTVFGPVRKIAAKGGGIDDWNYGASLAEHPIDVARYHRVIDEVRARSGFDAPAPKGTARGFAVHRSFLTYVAVVVEVSRADEGGPKLERAWVAADPGRIVNRDRVRAQLEGAVVFGATVALFGDLAYEGGKITARNFDAYPLLRMSQAPRTIDVKVITEGEAPGGIGEPGVPPVAPAIANAWFALTGERVRELPMSRTKSA